MNMQTISEIRLANLERLIAENGTSDKVAELCETSAVYISQLRSAAPDSKTGKRRQIGDEMARKLEAGCSKEVGWMDNTAPAAGYSHEITRPHQAAEPPPNWGGPPELAADVWERLLPDEKQMILSRILHFALARGDPEKKTPPANYTAKG